MKRFLQIIVLAVVLLITQSVTQIRATFAELYKGRQCREPLYTFRRNYASDLRSLGLDNRADGVYFSGIWIFYEHPNFNSYRPGWVEYNFSPDYVPLCKNFVILGENLSSLRFPGFEDYKENNLILFQGTYFTGAQKFTNSSLSDLTLDTKPHSMIITGHDPWTLYDQPNYKGEAICIQKVLDHDFYSPIFLPNVRNIDPWNPDSNFGSVKIGCAVHARVVVVSTHNANSGYSTIDVKNGGV